MNMSVLETDVVEVNVYQDILTTFLFARTHIFANTHSFIRSLHCTFHVVNRVLNRVVFFRDVIAIRFFSSSFWFRLRACGFHFQLNFWWQFLFTLCYATNNRVQSASTTYIGMYDQRKCVAIVSPVHM